jgi:asparagine synthase (glutamine-hydrolysing)
MCGIVGLIHIESSKYINDLTTKITHRGPDDIGIYTEKYISFGFQRLAIQDLSLNGHQPMFTQDKRYCIIFNGEIYNHWEIRNALKAKYQFKSSSDTETILYGYIEYGVLLFNKLNGIFAFSIYDTQTHELIIVRDQFGVKPLYFYQGKDIFAFSSEIKALKGLPNFNESLDYSALVDYIHFLWCPGEKTPFLHVKKLEAGHYIKLNAKIPTEFTIHKYYEIPFTGAYSTKTEKELIDELDEKLFNAVKRQLLSDVPVGFFLSGGLDSSAVVAMAKKVMPDKKLKCYTIDAGGMEDEGFANDLSYAKLVAKHLDVDLEIVEGKVDIIKDFDKMVYHLDEPQADAAPLHVLNICRKAREQGYVVLLGGTAGDDLFSGYRKHQALIFENFLDKIPIVLRKGIRYFSKQLNSHQPSFRRIRKLFNNAHLSKLDRLLGYYEWVDLDINKNLFSSNAKNKINNYDPRSTLINSLKSIPKEKSNLNQMLFWDMKYFLTDHNLNYTDKLSMAVGVEVRVPFLDKELVEFSTTIPPTLKLKGKTTKYLLKKVMERYLPHEVIYRPKTGFGAPVRKWILEDLQPYIQGTLNEKTMNHYQIFNFSAIQNLIELNKAGKIDASYTIFSLLAIHSWLKQFYTNGTK